MSSSLIVSESAASTGLPVGIGVALRRRVRCAHSVVSGVAFLTSSENVRLHCLNAIRDDLVVGKR